VTFKEADELVETCYVWVTVNKGTNGESIRFDVTICLVRRIMNMISVSKL
jgi:hypothetical protein